MHSLTFLQLGVHLRLPRLPSFQGLTHLKSLTLAILNSIQELPSFSDLEKLDRLSITSMPSLRTFPDTSPIVNVRSFIFASSGEVCCNGFLDNKCDPGHQFCQTPASMNPATPFACLPTNRISDLATDATRNLFAKFSKTACFTFIQPAEIKDDVISEDGLRQCVGVLYRQCTAPGNRTGMCYNPRMMPISRDGSILPIEMRKGQILEKVGDPCDPEVGAWLSCGPQ